MAEQNEDKKPDTVDDDKSINDLLKEYAADVKDKDLDDFLKNDEEDDVFESDDDKDEDETAEAAPKKSGGLFAGLVMLLAFGAAGAGAYMYLNRDEGMTTIMGGFMGDDKGADMAMELPPMPESTPAMPSTPSETTDITENPFDAMPSPTPAATDAPMPAPVAAIPPSEMDPPADDLVAGSAPAIAPVPEAAATTPTPAPTPVAAATPDASQAVSAWAAGNTDPVLPEKAVEEVKAKPVSAPKTSEKAAPVKTAPALPKVTSADDGALPPPYVAIQSKKAAPASSAPAVAAPAKMAPVVEGAASGARNVNEADVTMATGDTRAMVMNGGGRIDLGTTTVMPSVPAAQAVVAPVAEPAQTTVPRLAIDGGKSLPPEMSSSRPAMQAAPQMAPAAKVEAPVVETPAVMTQAPVATVMPDTSANAEDAQAMLARAMAAEKAGDVKAAIEMYQRALELDAVYGNGKSIDRGMVYDRIGAIRAAK